MAYKKKICDIIQGWKAELWDVQQSTAWQNWNGDSFMLWSIHLFIVLDAVVFGEFLLLILAPFHVWYAMSCHDNRKLFTCGTSWQDRFLWVSMPTAGFSLCCLLRLFTCVTWMWHHLHLCCQATNTTPGWFLKVSAKPLSLLYSLLFYSFSTNVYSNFNFNFKFQLLTLILNEANSIVALHFSDSSVNVRWDCIGC